MQSFGPGEPAGGGTAALGAKARRLAVPPPAATRARVLHAAYALVAARTGEPGGSGRSRL